MIKIRFKKEMHTSHGEKCLDIDIHLPQGEFMALYGESGAGKTTFLRILAGLTKAREGLIEVEGQVWFDSRRGIDLSVRERKIGFVSQENSLFPHMTVRGNLEYACASSEEYDRIAHWISTMGLNGLEDRKPHQLSGGQKQRAALIRALIRRPRILLLDEPLSDLEMDSRLKLQDEIVRAYQETRITTILVTHDLAEIFKLSQKVFVIEQGKIIRFGKPQDVFVHEDLSGKFRFTGHILEICKDGVLNILTLAIGNQVTKVAATDEEIKGLSVASQVIVAAKAFNPLILSKKK